MKGINDDELILQEQTLLTEGTVNEPHEEGSRTDLLEPATDPCSRKRRTTAGRTL